MKNYRQNFKNYLTDLGAKKPSPGGGSVAALVFCLGSALMEKAIVYSLDKSPQLTTDLKILKTSRAKIYPYIDLDAKLFTKVMANKGAKRLIFIKKSEDLSIELGQNCLKAALLYRKASLIKKGILSDFKLGINLIEAALRGAIDSLYSNSAMFGKLNPKTEILEKGLKTWPKS
jgi:hypothetical protein